MKAVLLKTLSSATASLMACEDLAEQPENKELLRAAAAAVSLVMVSECHPNEHVHKSEAPHHD